jgi:hypothetical protein
MSKTTKIIVGVALVVLLGATAFWFIRRSLRPTASVAQVPELPPPQPTPNKDLLTEEVMGKVRTEMEKVIDRWCKLEPGSYQDEDKLKSLWMRRFPTTPTYHDKGISNLIHEIHANDFFRNCKPKNIKFGSFVDGGAIQKVRDLQDFLNPCEPKT